MESRLNRLKAVLAEKGKSNKWLAENLGKNISTISTWCSNKRQPSLEMLFEMAEVLGVEAKDLIVSNTNK